MKQWAIKTSKGVLITNSASRTQDLAWDVAADNSKRLKRIQEANKGQGRYWFTWHAYKDGFRCVHVEVLEVEIKAGK